MGIALYDWRSGKIVVHGENLEPLLSTVDGARRYRGEWRVPVESADALAASGIIDVSEISHLLGIETTPVLSQHGAVLPVSMERVARKIGGEKINDRWYFNDASDVEILKGNSTNGRRAKVNGKAALVALGDLSKPTANGWTMFAHQQKAVESILSTDIAGKILGFDFGLGKTYTASVVAHALEKTYGLRTMVLCPASLKRNWARELDKMVSDPIILSDHHSQIPVNFEQPFVLIADEAHRLAGESQRGESFVQLAEQASFVLPLTGVPVRHGNPETAYNMLRAIGHPSAMMDRKVFASRYSGSTSLVEQLYRHTKDYIIRVQKRDVLDLPPKTRILRPVEIEPQDLEQYDRVYEAKKLEYQEGLRQGKKRAKYFNAALVHFIRQAASIAKVRTAVDIVEELLEQDRQVVLFVAYRETGRRLWRELHKYGMAVITGDTPVKDRQTQVDDFQKGKLKICLCTFGAAGFGLTLTKADTNILVDRPFSVESGDTDNAESRIDRISQLSPTTMVWLQFFHPEQKSPDERLDQLIIDKHSLNELALSGKVGRLEFADGLGDYMANFLFED